MATTIIKTADGKHWLISHNATWDGDAWFSHFDGTREVRLLTTTGAKMKAAIEHLSAVGVDITVEAPYPRLYFTSTDPIAWYGTDVNGKGWRWSRDENGWAERSEWPAAEFLRGEFALVPRHVANLLGFPFP